MGIPQCIAHLRHIGENQITAYNQIAILILMVVSLHIVRSRAVLLSLQKIRLFVNDNKVVIMHIFVVVKMTVSFYSIDPSLSYVSHGRTSHRYYDVTKKSNSLNGTQINKHRSVSVI